MFIGGAVLLPSG